MQSAAHGRVLLPSLSVVLILCGCRSTMGPKMPPAMGAPGITTFKADDFKAAVAQYRCLVSGSCKDAAGNSIAIDLPEAQVLRNQIAYRVMVDIEADYSRFEMNLTTQRAGFETGADTIQLGMSAAASLVGAADVKDILTASLTGFQGTRLSLDKNFFREKTTESIISQMRASRKTKQAILIKSLANRTVTDYPWEAVWIDLVDFYYAGTVPSALVEIASSTGKQADDANKELKDAAGKLAERTPEQAKQALDITAVYYKLEAAVTDPAKKAGAIQSLKNILTAVDKKPDDNASADDLLAQLRAAMGAAQDDKSGDKIAKLSAAMAKEKIE
ncbi:MAG TPA: hypothetical protein VG225_12510 [Terracidiphilus sp.]|nr:hypothetical protein [Terracidiphilus sp.]